MKQTRRIGGDLKQIEDTGSAVSVLKSKRTQNHALPKDLVLGTLVRFKQLKKWNLVAEILEWLRTRIGGTSMNGFSHAYNSSWKARELQRG
ncbi:hypothetical protein GH714_037088 [Hevea brasiliensis]|uniref:Uncharacterized protein n=1 Tax=Hevea brasiliensis TaxID=3981 RepID=A0A6A6M3J8_HEVBR|nr:hypothetical protein GH714_037088 [Hevea brasiliensis]